MGAPSFAKVRKFLSICEYMLEKPGWFFVDRVPLRGVGARGTPDLRQGWPVYQAATAGNLTMRSSLI